MSSAMTMRVLLGLWEQHLRRSGRYGLSACFLCRMDEALSSRALTRGCGD